MADKTLTNRIVDFMMEMGFAEIPSSTRRYRVFKRTDIDPSKKRYFVGRNGAVRVSDDGTLSKSRSVTESFKRDMEQWERDGEATA